MPAAWGPFFCSWVPRARLSVTSIVYSQLFQCPLKHNFSYCIWFTRQWETIYSNKIFIKCVHRSAERRRVLSLFHCIQILHYTMGTSLFLSLWFLCVKVHAVGKIDFRGLLTSHYLCGSKRVTAPCMTYSRSQPSKLKFFLQEGSENGNEREREPAVRLLICIQIPFKILL